MAMRIALTVLLCVATAVAGPSAGGPVFNEKGQLAFPADYREWVFLSSGLGMTYGPAAPTGNAPPMFDNVFVHPAAWAQFKESGNWPEGTMFVLEIRFSTSHGSINKGGSFQTDVAAVEVSVKDSKRFGGSGWEYFNFGGGLAPRAEAANALGAKSSCQACHGTNGAVENTFTQFYPVALEVAKAKGTLKASYQGHAASPAAVFHQLRESDTDPVRELERVKAVDAKAAALSEGALNRIGYGLMTSGKMDKAIAVLAWTAREYPGSANAQDSLAEAYEKAGRVGESVEATKKALGLVEADGGLTAEGKARLRQVLEKRLAMLAGK